jgi:hypothetical protein
MSAVARSLVAFPLRCTKVCCLFQGVIDPQMTQMAADGWQSGTETQMDEGVFGRCVTTSAAICGHLRTNRGG